MGNTLPGISCGMAGDAGRHVFNHARRNALRLGANAVLGGFWVWRLGSYPSVAGGLNGVHEGYFMVRCERCGFELSAEAERLLTLLRVELARMDAEARVELKWVASLSEPAQIDYSGRYPKGSARRLNGVDTTAAK